MKHSFGALTHKNALSLHLKRVYIEQWLIGARGLEINIKHQLKFLPNQDPINGLGVPRWFLGMNESVIGQDEWVKLPPYLFRCRRGWTSSGLAPPPLVAFTSFLPPFPLSVVECCAPFRTTNHFAAVQIGNLYRAAAWHDASGVTSLHNSCQDMTFSAVLPHCTISVFPELHI